MDFGTFHTEFDVEISTRSIEFWSLAKNIERVSVFKRTDFDFGFFLSRACAQNEKIKKIELFLLHRNKKEKFSFKKKNVER